MQGQDVTSGFPEVDQTKDRDFFIQFLDDANKINSMQSCKQRMIRLLDIKEGQSILDAGCGTGEDVREMAYLVGKTGQVLGIDYSQTMVNEAQRRAEGLNLSVKFSLGDTHNLEFPDNTFDACRSERSFMHLKDPAKALSEMVRVTRLGGCVVIFDFDWDAIVVDNPNRALTRKIVNFMSDNISQSWIGRRLFSMFGECGLKQIEVVPHTVMPPYNFLQQIFGGALKQGQEAGVFLPEELANWWQQLAEADQKGSFFAALQGFIVKGKKLE